LPLDVILGSAYDGIEYVALTATDTTCCIEPV